ncbi:hypothetical protein M1D55_19485 [Cupriavidus sp. JZ107]
MTRLDHGVLNIPGRLSTIDRELDAYKARVAREAAVQRKAKAADTREAKKKAKELLATYGEAIVATYGAKLGATALAKELDSMAKWEPKKFIAMAESFANRAGAAQ